MKVPDEWQKKTIDDLFVFTNGTGFKASDWSKEGLPIIRIQNMNGSNEYNYYNGQVEEKWLVSPGQLLFAWAGTKGVSFGPHIWNGPKGVLNQHIYKLEPKINGDRRWLYYALIKVTHTIEKKAHGFKSTLLHVQKSDITNQVVVVPPLPEQKAIANLLSTWDEAIEKTERLIQAKEDLFKGNTQKLIDLRCTEWTHIKPKNMFDIITEKNHPDEELLSVTQDQGVIPRNMLKGRVMSPDGTTASYKLIRPGDFAISLRSFQGGIEYSKYQGIISPAYTILRPKMEIDTDFYQIFFKTYIFIEKYLNLAVIGIRDGKQISIPDFVSIKIPYPPLEEQKQIAETLSAAQHEIDLLKQLAEKYKTQKRGLMQKMLTGEWRVKDEIISKYRET
ncbi:MAG TPA: restriction endonuclease subunit S [Chitinispirillaceae bacterium]|nr:restriction endonuclease subunit S [Chitinispirillaceae bacterium]